MRIVPTEWHVGIRPKLPQKSILQDKDTPFTLIGNSWRYEAADPFVFRYNGIDYVFAELIDKSNGMGCIGYTVVSEGKRSKWEVIIKEDYHLSFPYIFEQNGIIYIMPESSQAQCLYCYEAIAFPQRWKKCDPILLGISLVDTAILKQGEQNYYMSYELTAEGDTHGKLWVYQMDDGNKKLTRYYSKPISTDDSIARLGGSFFEDLDGKTIRVSQDCKKKYGCALVFSAITEFTETNYSEKMILRLTPSDIRIKPHHVFLNGLHTYNCNDYYEVVDIRTRDFSISRQLLRIKGKLKKYKR